MRIVFTVLVAGAMAAGNLMAQQGAAPRPGLTLTSTAFEDGGIIPARYTQSVPNPVSPKLEWTNPPAGVVSYTMILHDPDVSLQKKIDDVLHWMIFNIPGSAHELPEGVPAAAQLPDGSVQIKGTRDIMGFMGPGAPPAGPYHHYTFELYALDTKLGLGPDASRADVFKAMDGHILGKGVLAARFHR